MLAPVAAQRILAGVAANITAQFLDQDGEPASPGGVVTVDVTRADGTVVATGAATTNDAATVPTFTYTLAAGSNTQLDLLTVVWKVGGVARLTTQVDVVGGYYFTVAEARAFDETITPALASNAKIVAVRREVEDECERITGCAWVPRYRRKHYRTANNGHMWGWDTSLVLDDWAPRVVRSVRVYQDGTNYTALSASELASIVLNEWGTLERADIGAWLSSFGGTTVEYEYGYSRPTPELKHAALTRLRSRLKMETTGIPDRATSFIMAEGGAFNIATPGRNGSETGIPDVDAVYARHSVRIPGFV